MLIKHKKKLIKLLLCRRQKFPPSIPSVTQSSFLTFVRDDFFTEIRDAMAEECEPFGWCDDNRRSGVVLQFTALRLLRRAAFNCWHSRMWKFAFYARTDSDFRFQNMHLRLAFRENCWSWRISASSATSAKKNCRKFASKKKCYFWLLPKNIKRRNWKNTKFELQKRSWRARQRNVFVVHHPNDV